MSRIYMLLSCWSLLWSVRVVAQPVKIELPLETSAFKPGAGSEIANGQCLICHSVEYVVMQPPLPRTFWAASVKKMREKYGAPIPEEQVEPLVSYLAKSYGTETNGVAGGAAAGSLPISPALIPATTSDGALAKYGCLGCHNVEAKINGPPYKEVAAKYRDDPNAVAKITDQIHVGGSGKWGPAIMPPFPMVTDAEAKLLADWILSRK